ncbi:hydantoinase B/oxoprolinase family protein [Nocardioides sp. GY 10127]|nr:hydantoinase B/oxoprolinase family protein [Nocardioides sp. GY 10127]
MATVHGRARTYYEGEVRKIVFSSGLGQVESESDFDPITTEVVRHGLNAAADQMRLTMIRTSYSAAIYELLDFAVALYDTDYRMLAQSPTLPLFMGNLNFMVEAAVRAVGGPENVLDGDVIMYNVPYQMGGHPQDGGVVSPVYLDGELLGYAAVRAHVQDLAAKEPYVTDSTDVFQEGMQFPGVKLYRQGERVDDIWRIVLANTRFPTSVAGDFNAMLACLRSGREGLLRLVERIGKDDFNQAVQRIYEHGARVVRSYFEQLPDGRYTATGVMDGDGIVDETVPFDITVEIDGSTVRVDYSEVPDARGGPMNSCFPTTVAATRVAISMLAGAHESPNEGLYDPIEIVSRPGSMFHPLPPAPSYLTDYMGGQAVEVIYEALSKALPERVPACSSGDVNVTIWWGEQEGAEEPWSEATIHSIGLGGNRDADGASGMFHVVAANMKLVPAEVLESRLPWRVEGYDLTPDSGGAGRHRGGLGQEFKVRVLEDGFITAPSERMRTAPWGLDGGLVGVPNTRAIQYPGSDELTYFEKVTAMPVPAGSVLVQHGGGGGGYGDPAERPVEQIKDDLEDGYLTEAYVRRYYPQYSFDA